MRTAAALLHKIYIRLPEWKQIKVRLTSANGNRGFLVNAKDDEVVRALPVFGSASVWEPLIVGTDGGKHEDASSNGRLKTKNHILHSIMEDG
jgi:hypothetical protein